MKIIRVLLTFSLAVGPALPQGAPTFTTGTSVVVVDVSVLSRDGKPMDNLARDDFELYEDGKLQQLQACDLQRLDAKVLPAVEPELKKRPQTPPAAAADKAEQHVSPDQLKDRRLIVMLFDFSSMQPAEQIRSTESAIKFLGTQMTASDMVSIMVFGSSLQTVQEFTDDRDLLISTINGFHIGDSSELAALADTGADPEDQSGMFVADETEFNIFNTDRKLAALEDAARKLAAYPQKKALVYLSSGVEKTGVDNQSQLRATINTAVKANVAFYPIDARGLTALPPGGDASQAGAAGSNLYSGAGQKKLEDSFHNQQETLYSLAADTGGKALLDSNDLTLGMRQVQKDINTYYTLTYSSSNKAEDGRYRRIQVKLAPKYAALKVKLDYRAGYYAPVTFARMAGVDKETRLQQALNSENPITDLPLAVEVDYFRLARAKYFVPVSVKIPGSSLAFQSKGRKAATELDFIGEVKDARSKLVSVVRDTIPIKVDEATAGKVVQKQIQYDTGFTLIPGKYSLRFIARENGEGKTGTFEAPFTIPDLSSGSALRLSSLIVSNQREALKEQIAAVKNDKKLVAENPLIDNGQKIVPNVTKVFRPGQNLFVYFELYDPSQPENAPAATNVRLASVAANLSLFEGNHKVLETPQVRVNRLDAKRENVVPIRLNTVMKNLKPGQYTCQVNVFDELGRKFAFPRTPLFILAEGSSAPATR